MLGIDLEKGPESVYYRTDEKEEVQEIPTNYIRVRNEYVEINRDEVRALRRAT